MIDPVNDPIFGENSNTRKLLEKADESTVRNLASAWNNLGYTPNVPEFDVVRHDPASRDIGPEPEGAGFLDTLSAAWHLNNLTGAIAYRSSNALNRNIEWWGKDSALFQTTPKGWNVHAFAKENFGSFTDAVKGAYLGGELDDVEGPEELFARIALVEEEAKYRRDLANPDGFGGWSGAVLGSMADPVGILVGLGIGKVAASVYQTGRVVQGVTLASQLANLGAQQTVKAGLIARAGTAIGEGFAISTGTEAGLQMLDSERTAEESINNIATGIVFDSFLSAGLGALGRAPIFSKRGLQVIPDAALSEELRMQVEAAVKAKTAPQEVVDAVNEVVQARKGVNVQNLVQGTATQSYDDFLFSFPGVNPARSRAILDVLDKYGQNSLPFLRPLSSIERTTSGPLSMLYNYFVVPRAPTIGLAQGRSGGLMPFEMVSELVRSKGNMMQERSAKSFREYMKATGASWLDQKRILQVPEALWVGEKGTAYLAKQEAFYNLAGKVYVMAHNSEELLKTGVPLETLASAGFKNFKEAAPEELAKYLNRLGETDENRITDVLQKLYADTLPTMNELWIAPDQIRSTMGGPRKGRPVSLALMGDLQARLPEGMGSVDTPLSLDDFARLWDTQTGHAQPAGQLFLFPNPRMGNPDRVAATIDFYHAKATGIDEVDVKRAVPAHQTLGRLKNAYYNVFGGYVPARTAHKVATLRSDSGLTLAEFNYNRLLSQTSEAKHLFEGARQLKDYIFEAAQIDPRLKDKLWTKDEVAFNFDDAPYSLPSTGRSRPFERFFDLKGYKLQNWDTENGIPLPETGYRKELEDWTNEALAIIRQNVLLHVPETAEPLRPKSSADNDKWIDVEKTRTNDMVRMLKDRLGMQYAGKAHWEGELIRNVGALTRGMYLPTGAINQVPDAVNTIVATATSPFKGDMLATIKGALSQVRRDKLKPETVPFILDHIEYMNESLLSIMYRNTSYTRRVEELGTVKGFTPGERTAAWLEGVAQPLIAKFSLSELTNDFIRSAAFHSTNAQVTLKGGLISRMAQVLEDMDAGVPFQKALGKHDVPLFFGSTMMRDFTPIEIHAINALIEADSTVGLKTPRRFGLSRIMGDAEVKVIDLPDNPDLADKLNLQKLGAYMNFLMTREKLALSGWGDDLIGGTGNFWRFVGTFWAKPTITQFNRMFFQSQYKGDKAMAFAFLGGMLSSVSARFLKVWLNGNMEQEFEDADRGWGEYVTKVAVDRAAWAGILGVSGEKFAAASISGLLSNQSGRSGQNAFIPAPFSAMWQATQGAIALPKFGVSAALGDPSMSKGEADNLWKLASAVGFSNDTTMFRLMGQLGRINGSYAEPIEAADLKATYYKLFGVEDKR